MTKEEVVTMIKQKHQSLFDWLEGHSDQKWSEGPQGKWNTGEHIVHLIQSETALNKALQLPKFYLKYKFGTNNRNNRTYKEVVTKYQAKLAANPGVVANISKSMPKMSPENKRAYISKLNKQKRKLTNRINKWTEKDLDTFLLPHPLMGRMTIREIAMWVAYHTEHHHDILKKKH